MKTKRLAALLLAVLMMLSLCACGSSYKASATAPQAAYYSYDAAEAEEVYYEAAAAEAPMPTPAPAAGLADTMVNSANAKAAGRNESGEEPKDSPDKIIYSSNVTVETTKFDETVSLVNEMVERYDGWIESSSISGSNYYQTARGNASSRYASYTLRIPAVNFDAMMNGVSELGNVPYSHVYTENVTAQYYDVQARLTAYTAQEQRLIEMMELAESVEDVITIEEHLTEIRYKIESLQTSLNNWDRRVSYSTVYLEVQEVREYTPEELVNPTFGEELAAALKNGLRNAGQFLKELLVFLVEALPVLLVLVPVVWLVVWLICRIVKKSRAKKAAKKEKKAAKTQPASEVSEEAKSESARIS